jgi:class 3 adenylate cyclase
VTSRRPCTQQQKIIAPVIAHFRGKLVKWIGDAALAVFGSATDAVLCGRKIQAAFVEHAERGPAAIKPRLKVVVHAGDVMVDSDGDVYGDAVNFAARMEKAAEAEEVYFSEAVRRVISGAEIPYELVGEFEFKGITETAKVYRTCFGQPPLVRERLALVQTNFVGVEDLADRYGWDAVHPTLDRITATILEAARFRNGTARGTLQVGTFLTFDGLKPALQAVQAWTGELTGSDLPRVADTTVSVRVGIHWGTLHVMRHTMMGRDIDVARTLSALAFGAEALLSDLAVEVAVSEGIQATLFQIVEASQLRECSSKERWLGRYHETPVFAVKFDELLHAEIQ